MDKRLDTMGTQRRWWHLKHYPCMSKELMDVDAATSPLRVVRIHDLARPLLRKCPLDLDAINWLRATHLGTGVDGVVYRVYFGDQGPFVLKIFWIPDLVSPFGTYSAIHRECQNAALLQMMRAVMSQATAAAEAAGATADDSKPETPEIVSHGVDSGQGHDLGDEQGRRPEAIETKSPEKEIVSAKTESTTASQPRPRPTIWPQVFPSPLDFVSASDNLFAFSDEVRRSREERQRVEAAEAKVNIKNCADKKDADKNNVEEETAGVKASVNASGTDKPAVPNTGQLPGQQQPLVREVVPITSMPRFPKCYGWLKFNVHDLIQKMPRYLRVRGQKFDRKLHRQFDSEKNEFYAIVYEYIESEDDEEGAGTEEAVHEDGIAGKAAETTLKYTAEGTGQVSEADTTVAPTPAVKRYNLRGRTTQKRDQDHPATTTVAAATAAATAPFKAPANMNPTGTGPGMQSSANLKMDSQSGHSRVPDPLRKVDMRYMSSYEIVQVQKAQYAATRARTAADAVKYRDRVEAVADFLWLAGFEFASQPLARNWKSGVLVDHSEIIGPYSHGWARTVRNTKWSVDRLLTPD